MNRFIITTTEIEKKEYRIAALCDARQKLIEVTTESMTGTSVLGNIYIGRVENVVKNLNAAFVCIAPGQNCYLPLQELKNPVFTKKQEQKKAKLLCGVVDRVHVLDEVEHLVGVADLVVVPAHDLDERIRQGDTGLGVEDGRARIAEEVGGNDLLVGVAEDALELALAGLLHGRADLIVGGGLFKVDGQVDDGDIQRGNAHGHTGQLAVERGDDLPDGLGGAGGGGDDVARGRAAAAPVLQGRAVHGLLRGGDGVHGGHQAILDAEAVVQDLGDGGQAVRGARGVGDELHVARVGIEVDAADEHRRVILGRGGHDDLLRAGVDVRLRLFLRQEQARGFDDVLRANLTPGQIRGVALGEDGDLAAVDHDAVIVALHIGGESAVHSIVFQHVGQIIGGAEVIDAHDLDLRMLQACAKDHTANAAKAVNTDLNTHKTYFLPVYRNISNVWYI